MIGREPGTEASHWSRATSKNIQGGDPYSPESLPLIQFWVDSLRLIGILFSTWLFWSCYMEQQRVGFDSPLFHITRAKQPRVNIYVHSPSTPHPLDIHLTSTRHPLNIHSTSTQHSIDIHLISTGHPHEIQLKST